jgi:hypothetical protein
MFHVNCEQPSSRNSAQIIHRNIIQLALFTFFVLTDVKKHDKGKEHVATVDSKKLILFINAALA